MHEFFQLSGPVICNRIRISDGAETGVFPAFSALPAAGLARRRLDLSQPGQRRPVFDGTRAADGLAPAPRADVVSSRCDRADPRTRLRELPERRRRPRAGQALDRLAGIGVHDLCEELAWYDNVPVLSYLLLRGRCRGCGTSIGLVYPAVELLSGAPRGRVLPRLRLQRRRVRRVLFLPRAGHGLGDGSLAPDRAERGRAAGGGASCSLRRRCSIRASEWALAAFGRPSFSSWRRLRTPREWAWAT